MAFLLRLSDEETELLRAQAELEHRSMHEVRSTRCARPRRRLGPDAQRRAFITNELPDWAPVIERLGDS